MQRIDQHTRSCVTLNLRGVSNLESEVTNKNWVVLRDRTTFAGRTTQILWILFWFDHNRFFAYNGQHGQYALSEIYRLHLERSHRLCVETMQHIDQLTRSCVTLNLLGVSNLELEVMNKKCTLFGQICCLDPYYTVKQNFLHRLTSHYFFNHVKYGFIVATLRIITDISHEECIFFQTNTPGKNKCALNVRILTVSGGCDAGNHICLPLVSRFNVKAIPYSSIDTVGLSVLHMELRLIHKLLIMYCGARYHTVRQKFRYLILHYCGDDFYPKLASLGDEITLNIMLALRKTFIVL